MNICDIVDKKIAADQNATQIFGDQCVVVVKDQMYITNVILGACYVIAYICIGFIIKKIPKSLVLGKNCNFFTFLIYIKLNFVLFNIELFKIQNT